MAAGWKGCLETPAAILAPNPRQCCLEGVWTGREGGVVPGGRGRLSQQQAFLVASVALFLSPQVAPGPLA